MTEQAINTAIKLKSPEALDFILAKCHLTEVDVNRVHQAREKLQVQGNNWFLGGFLKS